MPRTPPENLQTFLQRQDVSTLAAVLLELAEDHEAVKARLSRLQLADRPDKLAAEFRTKQGRWLSAPVGFLAPGRMPAPGRP